MPSEPNSAPPSLTFADKRLMSSSLLQISRLIEEEAFQLAKQPPTWQFLAHALNWTSAPWIAPLPATSKTWAPVFREGLTGKFSYKSARDKLIELYNRRLTSDSSDPSKPILEAAQFLREYFTGGSLRELQGFVVMWYDPIIRRKPEAWWAHLPIFEPFLTGKMAVKFLEWSKLKQSDNTSHHSVRVTSYFLDAVLKKVADFTQVIPEESNFASSSEIKSSQLFSLSGELTLKAEGREQLRQRAVKIASNLVTAVPLAEQKNVDFVYDYVLKKINSELLHQTHRHFGRLQESLLGELVMAEFPMLYWAKEISSDKAAAKLPDGRRSEFTSPECAAIYQAITNLSHSFKVLVAQENHIGNPKLIAQSLASIKTQAGGLAFEHINALKLVDWVRALPAILKHPEASLHLNGIRVEQAVMLANDFGKKADEIHSFLNILYSHNRGMCGSLAGNFFNKNASYSSQDKENVTSMVKEEMLKTIASFNYRSGNYFSTYAYNRINMELRRKPHQERQAIKLSPELTTAQPRVFHLSTESDLLCSDPSYYVDISERYNLLYGGSGKLSLSAAEVADLLLVSKTQSLSVQKDDEDESRTIDLDWATHTENPITSSQLEEAAVEVRAILMKFAPAEELAISVLLQATSPNEALKRFTQHELSESKLKIKRLISSYAKKSPSGSDLAMKPASETQRVVLLKQSDDKTLEESPDE